jgi:TRAP-type mannitol/chloroaromatic compound transport system permease small subunit
MARRLRSFVLGVSAWCDLIARALCAAALSVLVATVLTIVVLRYGFGMGHVRLSDLAIYAFATLVALSVPVCLAQGGHVRVEVLSERLGARYRRGLEVVAILGALVPVFGLIIWAGWGEVRSAWAIRERAVETAGLPGLFLVRTVLLVAAALTIVQGLASLLRPPAPEGAALPGAAP